MPRTARIVVPVYPFHVTQRGNNKQNIFSDDMDREIYLSYLHKYSKEYKLKLYAYCLMDNHVHFIAVPKKEESLSKTLSNAHHRYSQYYNKKMKYIGHLWQGRYYSCLLDKNHILMAIRYVERNPVRAGIVRKAWRYKWSSAGYHTGRTDTQIELADITKYIDMDNTEWIEYLEETEDKEDLTNIREHTMKGKPLGGIRFIKRIGDKLGRTLTTRPRGRPKKKKNKNKNI